MLTHNFGFANTASVAFFDRNISYFVWEKLLLQTESRSQTDMHLILAWPILGRKTSGKVIGSLSDCRMP
jgi:hypothetical protein